MFKKALEFQGEKKYSGKDIKKLNALLAAKFGEGSAFGSKANVSIKSEVITSAQLLVLKSDAGEEYCYAALDARSLDRAMTAASNGERGKASDVDGCAIFPTLHWLWRTLDEEQAKGGDGEADISLPLGVPPVLVPPEVSRFLLNGADLMAPGLQGRQYSYPANALVAVYVVGNPRPVAVGQWQGNRSSGIAVQVLHRFGDMLWTLNPKKPEGFTATGVRSLADGEGSLEAAREAASSDGEEPVEDGAAPEPPTAAPVNPQEEMDALLLRSFLQAANTSLKQDAKGGGLKLGPLAMDVFYSQYVRPSRPVDSSVDVHKSTHKKVAKFVEYLKNEDFISIDSNSQIIGINRSSLDIRKFVLHEAFAEGDGSAAAGSGGYPGAGNGAAMAGSLYVEGVASSRVEYPLHALKAPLNPVFFDASGGCLSPHYRRAGGAKETSEGTPVDPTNFEIFVDKALILPALKDYCSRLDLMVSKKLVDVKRLGFASLLSGGDEDGADATKPITVESLARRILEQGTGKHQFHKVTTVSLLGEEKVSFRQGAPQKVDIRTEKRKNHNVTIVQGIDARCYGYDLQKVADFLKKKFSVATFLEEMGSANFIVVGGFYDRDLVEVFTTKLGIPCDCVQNSAAGRKAEMKQKKAQ